MGIVPRFGLRLATSNGQREPGWRLTPDRRLLLVVSQAHRLTPSIANGNPLSERTRTSDTGSCRSSRRFTSEGYKRHQRRSTST